MHLGVNNTWADSANTDTFCGYLLCQADCKRVDGGLTLDNSGLMVDAAEHYAKMGIERVVGMNMGSTGIESVITDLEGDD